MEQLTMTEIEDVMRVFAEVERQVGLRPHERELLAKLTRMRSEAYAERIQSVQV